jgi:hypothetical protein
MKKTYSIFLFLFLPLITFSQPSEYIKEESGGVLKAESSTYINNRETRERTIEFWFKAPDVAPGNPSQVAMIYSEGDRDKGIDIWVNKGHILGGMYNARTTDNWVGTWFKSPIVVDTWYHIALVLENDNNTGVLKWYVNGVLTESSSVNSYKYLDSHSPGVRLFDRENPKMRYPKNIDDWTSNVFEAQGDDDLEGRTTEPQIQGELGFFRVWNIARSQSDINAFKYKKITGLDITGLVAYSDRNNSHTELGDIVYLDDTGNVSYAQVPNTNWNVKYVEATTYIWKGTTDGVWDNTSNWKDAVVPSEGDYVVIDSDGGHSIDAGSWPDNVHYSQVTIRNGSTLDVNSRNFPKVYSEIRNSGIINIDGSHIISAGGDIINNEDGKIIINDGKIESDLTISNFGEIDQTGTTSTIYFIANKFINDKGTSGQGNIIFNTTGEKALFTLATAFENNTDDMLIPSNAEVEITSVLRNNNKLTVNTDNLTCPKVNNSGDLILGDNSKVIGDVSLENNSNISLGKNIEITGLVINKIDLIIPDDTSNVTKIGKINNKDNASIIIPPKGRLTLMGVNGISYYTKYNTSSLTVVSDDSSTGSLIALGIFDEKNVGDLDGTIKIQRWLDPSSKWHLFSSPTSEDFSGVLYGHYLNTYTESTGDFKAIASKLLPLVPGDGYVAKLKFEFGDSKTNPIVYSHKMPNTGDVHIDLDKDIKNGEDRLYFGLPEEFNLVGNPYSSRLDWFEMWNDSNTDIKNVVESTMYYYIDNGSANGDKNGWHQYNANTGVGDPNLQYINVGQGFGVKAKDVSKDLVFKNDYRTHEGEAIFHKKGISFNDYFELIARTKSYQDKIYFRFNEHTTSAYDVDFDAEKFNSWGDSPTPFFVSSDNKKLAICEMPQSESVNLGFNMATSGEVTFSLSNVQDFTEIILEDKVENTFIDLMKDTYTFNYSDEDAETGRFTIHFKKEVLSDVEELASFKVYSYGGDIYLQSEKILENVEISLYNLTGQCMLFQHFDSLKKEVIKARLSGVYILRIKSNSGRFTTKLILK